MLFRTALTTLLVGLPSLALALPQGGFVNGGTAAITTTGNQLSINQASQRTVIDWNSFNVAHGESVQFNQPSSNAVTLNRIHDTNPSFINGSIKANGQVWLINNNGILFGRNAQVNVGGLIATSSDIKNEQFLRGEDYFDQAGNPSATIRNEGHINVAEGGLAALVGPNAINSGTIEVKHGVVHLASGDKFTVDLHGDGLINVEVSPNVMQQLVENSGLIANEGGTVLMTAAAGEQILNSLVNMDGVIDANGGIDGDGGTVKLLSDGKTHFSGRIEAKGGLASGNGGFVETSGNSVSITGQVATSAAYGEMGKWLIDPVALNVVTGGGADMTASTVDPGTVVTALNGSNVTLLATNSITVTNAINASGNGSAGNLTLDAPTANLNALITLRNGSILSGTATTVNVGTNGSVQNGVDTVASGGTVNLANATYALSSQIRFGKNLTLNGDATNGSILDGQNSTRVMEIDGTGGGITVNLNRLTLTRGNGTGASTNGYGGALLIYSQGANTATVNITDSTISNSAAGNGNFGGGIMVDGSSNGHATLNLLRSTVSGNDGGDSGGGIFNHAYNNGTATTAINNSTITGNGTGVNGGGLYNNGYSGGTATMTITNSTITGNGTPYFGGGIYNNSGTLSIGNSIIAGNSANGDQELSGGETSLGYNLYGQNGDAGGYISPDASDILLTGNINTVLGSLANNGGFSRTMALVAGSPAINAGNPSAINSSDQRGITRGSAGSYTGSAADIGAYEARLLQVSADDKTITYGDTAPSFTYTLNSGPSGKLSGSVALSSSYTNAGSHSNAIGIGTLASTDNNFLVDFTPGDYIINQRSLGVTANALSKTSGASDPALTYSITSGSLISGDSFSGGLTRAAGENVGTYAITQGSLTPGSNYNLNFTGSNLTIIAAVSAGNTEPTIASQQVFTTTQ